jgi:hypothetical protein
MPELPPLTFPPAQVRKRTTRRSPRPTLEGPGVTKQRDRLGPSLERLTRAFEIGRMTATAEPAANPEQVLVLEVAGELTDFAAAVARIPGLEFLAEEAEELLESDSEFRAVDQDGKPHRYERQLYLVASDAIAWQQLLRLWDRYQTGQPMPRGYAKFRHLFSRLRTLRAWDDRDRLQHTGALDAWERDLAGLGVEPVEFEVELWLRDDEHKRSEASRDVQAGVADAGGLVLAESVRPEIGYHGMLARVPAERLLDAVARREVRWMRTGGVRFFHAVGQFAAIAPFDRDEAPAVTPADGSPPRDDEPRVALLDGVPIARHAVLDGRLVVDDPEGWESTAPAARRVHGTGMASVVVHGDLSAPDLPLVRRLYVRPILRSDAPDWVRDAREEIPRDRLPVDAVHAAVSRLFEGESVAPGVRVIVLAVGDAVAQFDRFVSPMARLLDWLAARHEILFLVSAGNHADEVELPPSVDLGDPERVQHAVLCVLQRTRGFRRLLAPAEAVNALTIGAAHADSTTATAPGTLDPMLIPDLPSVISAMGSGVRRSVKPDLLMDGGRQTLLLEPGVGYDGGRRLSVVSSTRPPGVRVASPATSGRLDATAYENGTSPATALAGHHAGHLLEYLEAMRAADHAIPDASFDAVLTKAALVHAAHWGAAANAIAAAQRQVAPDARARDAVARLVGYGRASAPGDVLRCDDHRVTVLAAERIAEGLAHVYRFPLPPSLAAVTHRRRLTITLAWLTPVNTEHRAYRRAALKVEPGGLPPRLAERADVEAYAGRRGTVQHDVLEGRRAVPFGDGDAIELVVSCRADAGELYTDVPYAVLVTLEVPSGIGLQIYQEVRTRLRAPIRVRPQAR